MSMPCLSKPCGNNSTIWPLSMNKKNIFFCLVSFSLALSACVRPNPAQKTPSPTAALTHAFEAYIIPTGTPLPPLPPYATPTAYYSAPLDGDLDYACRVTINLFFSYKLGFSIESYRSLFVPSSQYLADAIKPPKEATIFLLKLEPASQWWQEHLTATPFPATILPDQPDEYFYYVEYTGHYEPDTVPIVAYPDAITMTMIAVAPDSCKIMAYGKG